MKETSTWLLANDRLPTPIPHGLSRGPGPASQHTRLDRWTGRSTLRQQKPVILSAPWCYCCPSESLQSRRCRCCCPLRSRGRFVLAPSNYRQDFQQDRPPPAIHCAGRQRQNLRGMYIICLLYTSPSPRDRQKSRMPSSA